MTTGTKSHWKREWNWKTERIERLKESEMEKKRKRERESSFFPLSKYLSILETNIQDCLQIWAILVRRDDLRETKRERAWCLD